MAEGGEFQFKSAFSAAESDGARDSLPNVSKMSIGPRLPPPFPSWHLTDLSRWPLFSVLPSEIISTIKKICVFGSAGNEAIYITDTDEVFAFGSNCSSCLGLGT